MCFMILGKALKHTKHKNVLVAVGKACNIDIRGG